MKNLFNQFKNAFAKLLAPFFIVVILSAAFIFVEQKIGGFTSQVRQLNGQMALYDAQISGLQKQLAEVAQQKSVETVRTEVIQGKSQEELLTAAVANTAPAVVSIVISKQVPQLEVVYVNPFGDDPLYKDFGIRVPVYQQKGTQKQDVGAGTGFLIRNNGYILTNRHVVEDTSAEYTVLLANGTQKTAQVVYRDATKDIAIIKISGTGYTTENLGDSGSLKLGQSVFAIGNALGQYSNSVSTGIISGLNRTIQASDQSGATETLTGVIQTDAAINPGNSGGPLVDLNGNVVGVNVATVVGSNNISFSIPINTVKSIINSVLK